MHTGKTLALTLLAAMAAHGGFEHCLYEGIDLCGEWEMAYRPYAHETVGYPEFSGVRVARAIPGYWEDMVAELRAAGLADELRGNPYLVEVTFPMSGWAEDTTLPGVRGCFYYRRHVTLDRTGPAVLRFEGVRNKVHVWVNGRFAAFHAGFTTPFEMEIPDGLLRVGENEVVLAVSNDPVLGYCDYVCGLTTRSIYRSTGGVNGKLELRLLKSGLEDVYVTTAADLDSFTVHAAGRDAFEYEILDGEKTMAKGRACGDFTLPTDGYEFWSPERPKRYQLLLRTPAGDFRRNFGIRRLAAKGEKLLLNGKPVYLRGITEHCYFPRTIHPPRDLDYYRMVTARRRELGFNFVRFHTFVPPAEYLEATDELGMLVHIESPNFVSVAEYAEIVAFARTHPSVVIYCTGNETRIDRIAEAYLWNVANLVHANTDALFSPVSALRGIEYQLVPGKDKIVDEPFPHNPERVGRMAAYCDVFTSYQLGLTSYESLNSPGPETLDAWGDVYCGKPRLSHETCIDSSYADLSLAKMYDPASPIVKVGVFSKVRGELVKHGLLSRADVYFRNSCEWMRRIRKFTFEKLRAADRVAGFDFLGDINTHWHTFGYSVGMMDEFYRLKPGETVENVLRYNSPAVLLCSLGSDFNMTAGERREVAFSLSNYESDIQDAALHVELTDACGGVVQSASLACGPAAAGAVYRLGTVRIDVPDAATPRKYLLRASLSGGGVRAENEWELYAFPPAKAGDPVGVRVVSDISERDLLAALSGGESVLLLGPGPFKSVGTSYRIGMAGRTSGAFATVVKADHPIFRDFPHEGYCGWQFRRLMEGGRAVQLEADVPFDPVVDIAAPVKCMARQAALFEYGVGPGRLLVCSFNFSGDDPAAKWLRRRLADYAASSSFAPQHRISPEDVRALAAAPLVTGEENANKARNPDDPSSNVRAGVLALP